MREHPDTYELTQQLKNREADVDIFMRQNAILEQNILSVMAVRDSLIECLRDIAAMGNKAGSETAKNRLTSIGINWETGEPIPDYKSMT